MDILNKRFHVFRENNLFNLIQDCSLSSNIKFNVRCSFEHRFDDIISVLSVNHRNIIFWSLLKENIARDTIKACSKFYYFF